MNDTTKEYFLELNKNKALVARRRSRLNYEQRKKVSGNRGKEC